MVPLPLLLREATAELHARAERAGVMGELLRGRLQRDRYVALLRNLHGLYLALESRPLPVAPLGRTRALEQDLASLHGQGWADEVELAPSMLEYIRRLQQADAPALAAHAYVRYLGDLHGGQILAGWVRRLYATPGGGGEAFYDFGGEARLPALRAELRAALAALALDEGERARAAEEARWAFAQHIRLFEELAAGAGAGRSASVAAPSLAGAADPRSG